jgi:hypothetical protein
MIRVEFDPEAHPERLTPEQLEWWTEWKAKAEAATNEVIDAWEQFRQDPTQDAYKKIFEQSRISGVWGDLKDWLLVNVFNNKCAYCETPVGRSIFHAEHFRPKGRVTAEKGKVKIVDTNGNEIDHPGYFWLAFHWKNLLPSCALCNTVNGKKNQFPIPPARAYASIAKGLAKAVQEKLRQKMIRSKKTPDIFYLQPDDLDELEGRLLLHPYFDNPQQHLMFDDFGKAIAYGADDAKERGDWSIKVYNLNADSIVSSRFQAQLQAETRYQTAYSFYRQQGLIPAEAKQKAKEAVDNYVKGKEAYSAAAMDLLKRVAPDVFK